MDLLFFYLIKFNFSKKFQKILNQWHIKRDNIGQRTG